MKIKLVIEDKKKGIIEIPISKEVLIDLHDILWISSLNKELIETIKLNKCDKSFFDFLKKIEFIVLDVIYDGNWLYLKNKKYVPCRKKHYIVKKPQWK